MSQSRSKKINKLLLSILLCGGVIASFIYHAQQIAPTLTGLYAPLVINIELDKTAAENFTLVVNPQQQIYPLTPTAQWETDLKNTVIYAEFLNTPIHDLTLKANSGGGGNFTAIDNIAIFLGDSLIYFPQHEIAQWQFTTDGSAAQARLPITPLFHSAKYLNWYGGGNFWLKIFFAFITNPFYFYLTVIGIALLTVLHCPALVNFYTRIDKRKLEIISVIALLGFALWMRLDGLNRYNFWSDELFSAIYAASPQVSWSRVFEDPGNPPLYFLLLRIWFEIFGWSEYSGRLLSVIIGLLSIGAIYYFVKIFHGRKSAFFAAFLLTISAAHLGFSQEARGYILAIAFVPMLLTVFFRWWENGSRGLLIGYIAIGALLVNTHYYGALLIAANFIYYAAVGIKRKSLWTRETIKLCGASGLIAASLLPHFILSGYSALTTKTFNDWIKLPEHILQLFYYKTLRPSFTFLPPTIEDSTLVFITMMILLLGCILPLVVLSNSKAKQKKFFADRSNWVNYSIFVFGFVLTAAFFTSLKRPLFYPRYFAVLVPILCAGMAAPLFSQWASSRLFSIFRITLIIVALNFGHYFIADYSGVNNKNPFTYFASTTRKLLAYCAADSVAHQANNAAFSVEDILFESKISAFCNFYRLPTLCEYDKQWRGDFFYTNLYNGDLGLFRLAHLNPKFTTRNMLIIRYDGPRYPLKKIVVK